MLQLLHAKLIHSVSNLFANQIFLNLISHWGMYFSYHKLDELSCNWNIYMRNIKISGKTSYSKISERLKHTRLGVKTFISLEFGSFCKKLCKLKTRPVSVTTFCPHSNLVQISPCCNSVAGHQIITIFRACHNSMAVVPCTKFGSDH